MTDRRTFLSGLVSLPLIGGGVTLIGRPAQAVPLVQAAALPTLDNPRQRARYAWQAFSAAMRDLTADADGWVVTAAETRAFRTISPIAYLEIKATRYQVGLPGIEPTDLIVEHRERVDLGEGLPPAPTPYRRRVPHG